MGISDIIALSDGTLVGNPNFLKGSVECIESLKAPLPQENGFEQQEKGQAFSCQSVEEGEEAEGRLRTQTLTRTRGEERSSSMKISRFRTW